MECDLKASAVDEVKDNLSRDKDILQKVMFSKTDVKIECEKNYDSELLPPADRPSIQALIDEGRRPPKFRKLFDAKTGLDYYPFHR